MQRAVLIGLALGVPGGATAARRAGEVWGRAQEDAWHREMGYSREVVLYVLLCLFLCLLLLRLRLFLFLFSFSFLSLCLASASTGQSSLCLPEWRMSWSGRCSGLWGGGQARRAVSDVCCGLGGWQEPAPTGHHQD